MVGGQVADIEAEGQKSGQRLLNIFTAQKRRRYSRIDHRGRDFSRRPGRRCGAICARFGETIGWAFQVTDDILDVDESSAALGKTAGKDIAQQKATYPAVFGWNVRNEIANELANKGHCRIGGLWRECRPTARDCGISGLAASIEFHRPQDESQDPHASGWMFCSWSAVWRNRVKKRRR